MNVQDDPELRLLALLFRDPDNGPAKALAFATWVREGANALPGPEKGRLAPLAQPLAPPSDPKKDWENVAPPSDPKKDWENVKPPGYAWHPGLEMHGGGG